MSLTLTLVTGICWAFVYFKMIRLGLRDKTCCMPLCALALRLAWEAVYTAGGFRFLQVQTFIDLVWLILSIHIFKSYLSYGKEQYPEQLKSRFIPATAAVLVLGLAFQAAFLFQFEYRAAAQYSFFLQNAVTSVLFVRMFYVRNGTKGQSLQIAAARLLASAIPALQQGFLEFFNPYILICGAISLACDLYYIRLLVKAHVKE